MELTDLLNQYKTINSIEGTNTLQLYSGSLMSVNGPKRGPSESINPNYRNYQMEPINSGMGGSIDNVEIKMTNYGLKTDTTILTEKIGNGELINSYIHHNNGPGRMDIISNISGKKIGYLPFEK